MKKSKLNTDKKPSNRSKKSNSKTSWKSKSNNTGKKIPNRSKQSNPNTSWKAKSNSHLDMIKSIYGDDYGKKGIEMSGFFRENGYYAIADFLENGKQ